MEYQVPQFIEVEDKIIGPFTLKQFIYLAGGAGIVVVLFVYFPLFVAIPLAIPFVALAGALAFYKVNGKPFIEILQAAFEYLTRNRFFLWRHEAPAETAAPQKVAQKPEPAREAHGVPRLSRGKLSELAWSLDAKSPKANEKRT